MFGIEDKIYGEAGLIGLILLAGLVIQGGAIGVLWKWGNRHANRHEESLRSFVDISESATSGLNAAANESAAVREHSRRMEAKLDSLLQENRSLQRDFERLRYETRGANEASG